MKVIYGRISSDDQNEERQLEKGVLSFIDKCSGSISFFDRPQAKKEGSTYYSFPGQKTMSRGYKFR